MDCKDVFEFIQRHLDSELNKKDTELLEKHTQNCELCKKQLYDYKFIMDELEQLDIDILDDEISSIRHKIIENLFSNSHKIGIKDLVEMQEKTIKNTFIFIKFMPGKASVREGARLVSKATKEASKIFLKVGFKTLKARLVQ